MEIDMYEFNSLPLCQQINLRKERQMKKFVELKPDEQEKVLDANSTKGTRDAVRELFSSEPCGYYFCRRLTIYPL